MRVAPLGNVAVFDLFPGPRPLPGRDLPRWPVAARPALPAHLPAEGSGLAVGQEDHPRCPRISGPCASVLEFWAASRSGVCVSKGGGPA